LGLGKLPVRRRPSSVYLYGGLPEAVGGGYDQRMAAPLTAAPQFIPYRLHVPEEMLPVPPSLSSKLVGGLVSAPHHPTSAPFYCFFLARNAAAITQLDPI